MRFIEAILCGDLLDTGEANPQFEHLNRHRFTHCRPVQIAVTAPPAVADSRPQSAHETYAYRRIAGEVAARIADGTLKPGDRLPSVRRTSAQWGVSIPTVLQAYRLLEAQRVVAARPKSGFFVLARSASRRVAEPRPARAAAVAAPVTTRDLIVDFLEAVADPRAVPLGTALPDPAFLPTTRLARVLGAVVRRERVRSATISTPSGAEELRAEIARRTLATRAPVSPDDVVITSGCAEAIALGLRALTTPGDAVAVESPAYFGTLQAIDALGLRALEVSTDPREGIRLDALEMALGSSSVAAVVLTPNVHNPLGCVMPDERKHALAGLLDRFRIPTIEDDTYAELCFSPDRPASLRAFVRAAPVLSCGSFSKTLAPAYRVGWMIPGRYRSEVMRLKAATTVATALPPQLAIAEFLRVGGYDHHLRQLTSTLHGNLQRMTSETAVRFPPGTRISSPAGGFLLWVELPESVDALELYRRCMAREVSLAPGPVFSATGGNRNFIRLNGGLLWSPQMEQAVDVIAAEAARMSG
jgi:DNA-binding transcriptional MocR family regulator